MSKSKFEEPSTPDHFEQAMLFRQRLLELAAEYPDHIQIIVSDPTPKKDPPERMVYTPIQEDNPLEQETAALIEALDMLTHDSDVAEFEQKQIDSLVQTDVEVDVSASSTQHSIPELHRHVGAVIEEIGRIVNEMGGRYIDGNAGIITIPDEGKGPYCYNTTPLVFRFRSD